jgi:hypothetical protein
MTREKISSCLIIFSSYILENIVIGATKKNTYTQARKKKDFYLLGKSNAWLQGW